MDSTYDSDSKRFSRRSCSFSAEKAARAWRLTRYPASWRILHLFEEHFDARKSPSWTFYDSCYAARWCLEPTESDPNPSPNQVLTCEPRRLGCRGHLRRAAVGGLGSAGYPFGQALGVPVVHHHADSLHEARNWGSERVRLNTLSTVMPTTN